MIPIPPKTEEQKASQKKYMESVARVGLTMEPEKKKRLQEHANKRGESVNSFVNRAIDETIERERGVPKMGTRWEPPTA